MSTMSIDPAAFTRTDSISTPILPTKSLANSSSAASKPTKTVNTPQRLDYEQIYTGLKAAIGERWGDYKEALSFYLCGVYSESDFNHKIEDAVLGDPTASHLHDCLLAVFYCNLTRELPDHPVATWVSANDKPTAAPKPVSGDAAEQRLKVEVMQLPARDRRRLKGIPDPAMVESQGLGANNYLDEYHQAKQIRLPELAPASAGGLNKTNWDLEIRKRYTQPLASETLEFPDTDTIFARMTPICYEESIPSGTSQPCAELVANATETFVKETLSMIFTRTRSNGPVMNGGILTRKYRQQLQSEEEGWLRGEVEKNSGNGLLPVEVKEAQGRRALGMADLRLAMQIGGGLLGQMPLAAERVAGGWLESEDVDEEGEEMMVESNRLGLSCLLDGGDTGSGEDAMELDENDWGWEGAKESERQQLGALLDGLLSSS